MSLYDIAVADGGQHERGAVLLAVLGSPPVARFRDAWAEKDPARGLVIHLYTRQGGGNRDCFCEDGGQHVPSRCSAASNDVLTAHPLYLNDRDDEFDGTYVSFWFQVPDNPEIREALAKVAVDPVDTGARWREAIARVERGELNPRETAMMDQIGAALADTSPDAPKVIGI